MRKRRLPARIAASLPSNHLELRRQLFHLILGIAVVVLVHYGWIGALHVFAVLVLGLLLSFVSTKRWIPVISWFLNRFERPANSRFPGKGVIFYAAGVLLVLVIPFPKDIATASIAILAVGDSVSHIVGRYFGRTRNPLSRYKLLEGFLAGLVVSFIAAIIFVRPLEAFIGALAAMTAESLEIKINENTVDDNLTIPLVAASAIVLLRAIA